MFLFTAFSFQNNFEEQISQRVNFKRDGMRKTSTELIGMKEIKTQRLSCFEFGFWCSWFTLFHSGSSSSIVSAFLLLSSDCPRKHRRHRLLYQLPPQSPPSAANCNESETKSEENESCATTCTDRGGGGFQQKQQPRFDVGGAPASNDVRVRRSWCHR